jgi:16S rRNA (cytosine1402-N4)-methyltransferase
MEHLPIMLHEVIEALDIKKDGLYVDGTFGRGGHSRAILDKLTTGHLVVFDQDERAIETANKLSLEFPNKMTIIQSNFKHLNQELDARGFKNIDGILLDLGVSSPQFDDPSRGFSYRFDTRLDMRMDLSQSLDAYQVINHYSFEKLMHIFQVYGEEKFAKQIARKIEKQREIKPIETSFELVDIIRSAYPSKVLKQKGHPAKQVFQAIRIEVNQELEVLKSVLEQAVNRLNPMGRLVILTFHSLEDRMVKQYFSKLSVVDVPSKIPLQTLPLADYELVNRKVITSSEEELSLNPRAQSAKLRAIRKR